MGCISLFQTLINWPSTKLRWNQHTTNCIWNIPGMGQVTSRNFTSGNRGNKWTWLSFAWCTFSWNTGRVVVTTQHIGWELRRIKELWSIGKFLDRKSWWMGSTFRPLIWWNNRSITQEKSTKLNATQGRETYLNHSDYFPSLKNFYIWTAKKKKRNSPLLASKKMEARLIFYKFHPW